jgi:prepilin-type N-terminal cleavage/methylation domain-containing protein
VRIRKIKHSFHKEQSILMSIINKARFNFFKKTSPAFTIVELLVVIVIIGILAAITIVAYTGVTQRATQASLQSDLATASQQLKLYSAEHGSYPTSLNASNCPLGTTNPSPDNNYCLKASSGNTFSYVPNTSDYQSYNLYSTNTNSNTNYRITDNSSTSLQTTKVCPYNFIVVPGSTTYSTSDFCVMKYEASHTDATATTQGTSTIPISQSNAQPWVSISQTSTITYSQTTKNSDGTTCTSCHLITEAEWMTIAQNVLSVASNWRDNVVGTASSSTNYIYSGHNDGAPNNALVADSNDNNGYTGTGNYAGDTNTTSGMVGNTQRRTLTLTNGEVIWDLAGNVYEWTTGTIAANAQPGLSGESAYASKQWNNASLLMNGLPYNSQPASTGMAGISGWSSTQGIGTLYSNYGETGVHVFFRSSDWGHGSNAGVLCLNLDYSASTTNVRLGYRVSR